MASTPEAAADLARKAAQEGATGEPLQGLSDLNPSGGASSGDAPPAHPGTGMGPGGGTDWPIVSHLPSGGQHLHRFKMLLDSDESPVLS